VSSGALSSTHRCTVLVVEDDADVRELLRVALSADGYEVATVDNGRDAMYYLRSHADACIILLDLALPIMDGAQFRRAQLRDRALAWVPLVVMSGSVDAARHARVIGALVRISPALLRAAGRASWAIIGGSPSAWERRRRASLEETPLCSTSPSPVSC